MTLSRRALLRTRRMSKNEDPSMAIATMEIHALHVLGRSSASNTPWIKGSMMSRGFALEWVGALGWLEIACEGRFSG